MKRDDPFEIKKRDEDDRIEQLRKRVDSTAERLRKEAVDWDQARQWIEQIREQALSLFPDKAEVFDLIYKPRFYRILDEKLYSR